MMSKKENKSKKLTSSKHKYNQDEVFASLESITVILESGADIGSTFESVAEDSASKKLRSALQGVSQDLKSGSKLWESFESFGLLSPRYIENIRIGEEGGLLLENLKLITKQRRSEKELSSKLKSAMIYPFIILTIGILVGIGTAWFVLPKLTMVYSGLDTELPVITQILISVGDFVRDVSIVYVILGFILLGITLTISLRLKRVRILYEKFLIRTPGIKTIIQQIEISRMGVVLGSLLTVGINIDRAMKSLREATPFILYQDMYQEMYDAIVSGSSFKTFFREQKSTPIKYPSTVRQMIEASERSGNLPDMFLYIGDKYRKIVDITTQNLTVIIEPILLILIWVFVAVIALAILMPIYSLIGSF